MITLRDYQREAIELLLKEPEGKRYMFNLGVGLGKSATAANIPRNGKLLWLAQTKELVEQPARYFACDVGVEMAEQRPKATDEIVLASVQSMCRRFGEYPKDYFDIVIADEAIHCAGRTYKSILEHFEPRYTVGLSGWTTRADGVRLDDVFDKVVIARDIFWGIENNYLCDIKCKYVKLDFDLSNVKTQNGDYNQSELANAMDGTESGIAQAYREHAIGKTIIFASSVKHAYAISSLIDGSKVVVGTTPKEERRQIVESYSNGDLKCLINVGVFVEGYDVPMTTTIIHAKPTKSESRYVQATGRALRKATGKEYGLIIDCVGVSNMPLCSVPSLLGYDMPELVKRKLAEKDEFSISELAEETERIKRNNVKCFIASVKDVDLFKRKHKLNLHEIAFRKLADGRLQVTAAPGVKYYVPPINSLGKVNVPGIGEIKAQSAVDMIFAHLKRMHYSTRALWSKSQVAAWSKNPMSAKQAELITKWSLGGRIDFDGIDINNLTCGEASCIIDEVFGR
jgi:superfamily II DNA or RNA helicase